MTTDSVEEPEPLRVPPGLGYVLGFAMLAVANAVFIAIKRTKGLPVALSAAHHFFDAGQLLGAGMLVYAAREAWRRWGPKKVWLGYLPVALLSLVLGALFLDEDLIGPVVDLLGEHRSNAVYVFGALGGLAIVGAAVVGRFLQRKWFLRLGGIVVATVVGAANNILLPGDYRGIHMVLGLSAATLFGASLELALIPQRLSPLRAFKKPGLAWAVRALVAIPALLAIVIVPGRKLRVELFKYDGAIIAPMLIWQKEKTNVTYVTDNPWFKRRDRAPNIPASQPPLVERPIVLLITMDSFRAELLEKPEYAKKMPALKELADESVYFTQARSPGSGTVITFSQIFTGKHHFQLHWSNDNKRALPNRDPSPRFPELLTSAGVQTVTFASFPPLMPDMTITRGFTEATLVQAPTGQDFALSQQIMDEALVRIKDHDGDPLFFFTHLMDPHHPYNAAGTKGSGFNRYVAEAALCSESIARLIETLKSAGLWDRTILIVAADHGEGFNKHGVAYHNLGLYEEILHVPLLIRAPGAPARKVSAPVSLIDLGPTILDLFGVETPGAFMGQSLVPFLRGEDPELTRPLVSSTLFKSNAMYAFPYKVIFDRKKQSLEVYDLETDPDERTNLADSKGDEMQAMLESFMQVHAFKKK